MVNADFKTERIKQLCRKLKPILGSRIDKIWQTYSLEDEKGKEEIEEYLKLLAMKVIGNDLEKETMLLYPPKKEKVTGDYFIGNVVYNDDEIYPFGLREDEWIQHVGIFGRSGAGKTNLGFHVVRELVKKSKPFILFDWKRNYRDLTIVPGFEDILIFTLGRKVLPLRFNPLIPPKGTDSRTWLKKLIEIIAHAYYLGNGVMYLLQKAINAVYEKYGVYSENASDYPTFRDVLRWLKNYKATAREVNWLSSTLRAIQTLCFGQVGYALNARRNQGIDELLEKKVILELDALTHSDKIFFIEALILWIHHFRLAENVREEFKHAIIIEEAHHILSGEKASLIGGEMVMETTFREIREFGESMIIIDQHPSQISLPALGNTYCTICMNLKHRKDVNVAANCMLLDDEDKQFLGTLEIGEAIVKLQGRIHTPFLIKIPEFEISKGLVSDEQVKEKMASYFAEILQNQGLIQDVPHIPKTDINEDETSLLIDILKYPFSGVVERYERVSVNRRKGNKIKNDLFVEGFIEEKEITLSNGRIILLELTEKAKSILEEMGFKVPRDTNGIEHRFWKHKIANYYRKKGYEVHIEEPVNGNVDVLVINGDKKIAVEVETGKSDVIRNIEKCLKAGIDEIVIVAVTSHVKERIERDLRKRNSVADGKAKIILSSVHAWFA
jgi:hypothetical protein